MALKSDGRAADHQCGNIVTNNVVTTETSTEENDAIQIPVVCIVLSGGLGTINTVYSAVTQGTPVIIVNETGRAANLMAKIMLDDNARQQHDISKYEKELRDIANSEPLTDEIFQARKALISCLERYSLLTVWDQRTEKDMDEVILEALAKAPGTSPHEWFMLALKWDRYEMVDDTKLQDVDFQLALTYALTHNRTEFIALILKNVNIKTYLTDSQLEELYSKASNALLKKLLEETTKKNETKFQLSDIDQVIRRLTEDAIYIDQTKDTEAKDKETDAKYTDQTKYAKDTSYQAKDVKDTSNQTKDIKETLNQTRDATDTSDQTKKDKDQMRTRKSTEYRCWQKLFLYAVLNGFDELADDFWYRGQEAIPAALAASILYKSMASLKYNEGGADWKTRMEENAGKYEDWAFQILTRCQEYRTGVFDPAKLLTRILPNWGYATCLNLAESGENLKFLSHPVVKSLLDKQWHSDIISHIVFIILFSYNLLSLGKQINAPENWSWMDTLLFFWVISMVLEEVRQLLEWEANTFSLRIWGWWSSNWNKIDIMAQLLFLLGSILRYSENVTETARIILAIDIFIFYFRLLEYLTFIKSIGPKIFMIGRMFIDLGFFVCIIFIVLIGYGVTMNVILYPDANHDPTSMFETLLYRPYFQIYGELFLDEIRDGCDDDAITLDGEPCSMHPRIGTVLLAVYLAFTNVLLLNLLIAMFSNTFDQVQEQNVLHWRFQRYGLSKEYLHKPIFAPPLIILSLLGHLLMFLLHALGVVVDRCNGEDESSLSEYFDYFHVMRDNYDDKNEVHRKDVDQLVLREERKAAQFKQHLKKTNSILGPSENLKEVGLVIGVQKGGASSKSNILCLASHIATGGVEFDLARLQSRY
ncbi:transient receptor potential cation channel subfamily M member 2-like [Amphiura filiformis]|uniref:transient receptor potential cation channel subfamily M member 2-like n=1 Tax=Amphiura filiformis TaxID=82378 RepID=UPI003B21DB8E